MTNHLSATVRHPGKPVLTCTDVTRADTDTTKRVTVSAGQGLSVSSTDTHGQPPDLSVNCPWPTDTHPRPRLSAPPTDTPSPAETQNPPAVRGQTPQTPPGTHKTAGQRLSVTVPYYVGGRYTPTPPTPLRPVGAPTGEAR